MLMVCFLRDTKSKTDIGEIDLNRVTLDSIADNDSEEKLLGTTVIPMPEVNLSPPECDKVGLGRTNCSCLDPGTYRCVQQHVMEAREELRRILGNEKFVKLGFCDMGEVVVARRWSEEEEQAFLEVVYSNPASLGRKFWKHLSAVFPSRSKRELVSYYFNVFMLRRRATQNRSIEELELPTCQVSDDDDEKLKAVLNGCIRKITNNPSKGITSKMTENEDKEEAGLYLQAGNSASEEIGNSASEEMAYQF